MHCKVFIINKLNHLLRRSVVVVSLFICPLIAAKAQTFDYFPDSTKKALATLPESLHDSIYEVKGSEYYAQFNPIGYNRALDCFNRGLTLAEKYQHKDWIMELTHDIGAVYDAQADNPEKTLYYYKKVYELSEDGDERQKITLAYDVAHAYNLLRDSANSMQYLNYLKRGNEIYKNDNLLRNKILLLRAYLSMKNNNMRDFVPLFESIDTGLSYKNGRFPYGRYLAICAWHYAFEKGNYPKAIERIQLELKNNATDSSILMAYLGAAYARTGDYQNAYFWAEKLNTYDELNRKRTLQKDLKVKLLQTDNELKEREKALKEREIKLLLVGFVTTLLLMSIALFYWSANYKKKKILAERNAEKDVLINEIHHRVKNNLQLLYGLAKLQLPTIKDEKAKSLWQKHLSQLQAMTLVNEKLYAGEGIASLSVKTFVTDILHHFEHIFPNVAPLSIDAQIDEKLVINPDFAVSFGLILSELVTNSYKYAFPNVEKPLLKITISNEKEQGINVHYTDFHTLADPSVIEKKQVGGSALIRDLTRQLKGKLSVTNEPYLIYQFDFMT
jgi:two-component sensor histidine kinase